MSAAITLEELLAWNDEAARYWKSHLEANPHLLALPCDIGPAKNVQEFVRHIWTAELRWAQCLAGVPVITKEQLPEGRSMRCSLCTRRQCRSIGACWLLLTRNGASLMCWSLTGCR